MKSCLLFLIVAGLLFSACSEQKERPEGPGESDELSVHPEGWVDPADSVNFHGKKIERAGWSFAQCTPCHGADFAGGIAESACTTCHPGTPRACGTCHPMPPASPHPSVNACYVCHPKVVDRDRVIVDTSLHMNGQVDVSTGCGGCHGLPPASPHPPVDACYVCHPKVVDRDRAIVDNALHMNGHTDVSVACNSCHGLPPASPHPPLGTCSLCHSRTVDADRSIVDRTVHMNGVVDAQVPGECNACHGSEQSAAPPRDASGNTLVTDRGVGAHQMHVKEGTISRAFDCSECHVKPSAVTGAGHIDSDLPAEVTFGALARGEGTEKGGKAVPAWDSGALACRNTYCHGAFTNGNQTNQPEWTAQRSSSATCGTCHALPPPAPHPQLAVPCSVCHGKVVNADLSMKDKSLHINGKVDY